MLNDQEIIRAIWPQHTVKWLARLMDIPLRTARVWAERTVPVYRREEFGKRLLDEYYRDMRRREDDMKWRETELLPAILKMAGQGDEVLVPNTTVAGVAADLVFAAQHWVEAAIDRLEADKREINGRSCRKYYMWW